jgi:glutamate carboxypeptidase
MLRAFRAGGKVTAREQLLVSAERGSIASVLEWLGTQRDAMIALLRAIVDIDSGSYNKPGIDAVGAALRRFLEAHGVRVQVRPQPGHGDCLRAELGAGRGPVVLLGHCDTVFPDGEAARRPFSIGDGNAYGPGVADMKAGLVMNAFVIAAFARAGGAPCPLVGLFTGDEEIGSPEGRGFIEAEVRGARAVFNSEPGRVSGNVVTGRKGGVFMVLRISGKAAHAGSSYAEGISAIEELARKIPAIHALTDLERGITLNVGLISGGQSVNTVAPWAEARIDARYVNPADREAVVAAVRAIAGRAFLSGTTGDLAITGEFLPLVASSGSRALFANYCAAAQAIGFDPQGEFTGGCADSGFTAAQGVPTICGVGPVGGRAHTPYEFLRLESLIPRAQACVRTIANL